MSEWKLADSVQSKPKSTIAAKKKTTKRAGLGTRKVVDLKKLEKESNLVAQDQIREKTLAKAVNVKETEETTKVGDSKVSKEKRQETAARLGMGGGNMRRNVGGHGACFSEIKQINPVGYQPKPVSDIGINEAITGPSSSNSMNRSENNAENSTDISDLLHKSKISQSSAPEPLEFDKHGLVSK